MATGNSPQQLAQLLMQQGTAPGQWQSVMNPSGGYGAQDSTTQTQFNLANLPDGWAKSIGFNGPVMVMGADHEQEVNPDLLQYMQQNGIDPQRMYSSPNDTYTVAANQNGQQIGNPLTYKNTTDNAFWNAAMLAAAGIGGGIGAGAIGGGGAAATGSGAIEGGTNLFADGAMAPSYGAGGAAGGATEAAGGGGSFANLGDYAGGAGGDSTLGSSGSIANTGSDAHFYQPQAGGTGVQDLGNIGGASGDGTGSLANLGSMSNTGSYGSALTQLMQNGVGKGLAGLGAAGVGSLLSGGGSLDVPNYTAAAQAQGASGRTDQSNPWGSLTYSQNGVDAQGNPIYKQNVSLNPADQANLDQARQGQSSALSGLNNSISGYADAVKGLPGLYGDAGSQSALTQQAIDAAYHQQSALLDPQYQKNSDALTSQLANQGVTQGSAAYQQAMDEFARQRDYAYGNARDSSISQGNALANQLFNQNLQAHTTGMNDLNTQQNQYLSDANGLSNTVKQPTFAAPPTPTNYLGAAALQGQGNLNQYNAKIGNTNSLNNGLFSLGGAVLSNPTWTNAIGNLFSTGGGG